MNQHDAAVAGLLSELEKIGEVHHELYDSDVRELIHRALTYYYVWGHECAAVPVSYAMFSDEADVAVARAVQRFLAAVEAAEVSRPVAMGPARLAVLQTQAVRTPGGRRYYELYGHRDDPLEDAPLPDHMFQSRDDLSLG